MTLTDVIRKKPYLFWYIKDPTQLSEGALVEGILSYGDFDDVKQMIAILGIKKTASIFRKQLKKKRVNYDSKTINYFKLYFKKYA